MLHVLRTTLRVSCHVTLRGIFYSLFYSFITLCENEYFLVSNLHCSLTNAALCPLVLMSSLCLKNIFRIDILLTIQCFRMYRMAAGTATSFSLTLVVVTQRAKIYH